MNMIKNFISNKFTLAGLKLGLGFIFVVASLGKIVYPEAFMKDVYSYVLLPNSMVPLFAYTVPWIEFIAGLMLMFDIMPQSCALIINALLVSFMIAIAIDIKRGIDIECGCFDFLFPAEKIGWNTVIRDFFMLVAGLIIMFFDMNKVSAYGVIKKLNSRKNSYL